MTGERRGPVRSFAAGVGDLGAGFRFWATDPRLMLLGAVPAVIVGAVWAALLLWLLLSLDGVAAALTPFAARWDEPWRGILGAWRSSWCWRRRWSSRRSRSRPSC